LKKQLEAEEKIQKINIDLQEQLHITISRFKMTDKANNRTVQELREKEKQQQVTIDELTKTAEALNRTLKEVLCAQPPNVVSTCKIEAFTTSKWTEIRLAMTIFKSPPNIVVS
jgi:phage gp16-like protein